MNNDLFEGSEVDVTCKECGASWHELPENMPDVCPFCRTPINAIAIFKK